MSESVEQVALRRIIQDGDILPFISSSINAEFFVHPRWSLVWPWVHDYWMKHQVVPPLSAFERQWQWPFPETDEPVSGIIEELIRRRRVRLAEEHLGTAVTELDADHIDESLNAVRQLLSDVDIYTSRAMVSLSPDTVGRLLVNLRQRTGMEGLVGIPTGFNAIDLATGGYQPEQLITLTALPKHGKSTVLLKSAMAAEAYMKKVMLFSFEMSEDEMMERYLCMGAGVALETILRGKPSPEEQKRLDRFEEETLDLPGIIIVHDTSSVLTVSGVAARIREHTPDIVFVDGAYMMADENGETDERKILTNMTRAMKRLCQSACIPIFMTTQSLIQKTGKKTGTSMGSIGYSSSFIQDSDVILGLDRPDLEQPQATLKIIAARSAKGMSVELYLDYDSGIVEESGAGARPQHRVERGTLIDDGDGD